MDRTARRLFDSRRNAGSNFGRTSVPRKSFTHCRHPASRADAGGSSGGNFSSNRTVPRRKLWEKHCCTPRPKMNSVLPPPTSSNNNGLSASSRSVVTPRNAQLASCSPEMISTFSPLALFNGRGQIGRVDRIPRRAGGNDMRGDGLQFARLGREWATARAVSAIGPDCSRCVS